VNVLPEQKLTTIITLLRRGLSHRKIARLTGAHRATIKRAERQANCTSPPAGTERQTVPPRPPAFARQIAGQRSLPSRCEPYRGWIEKQAGLGRSAVAIYQDLVEMHGFGGKYVSVRRFVKTLRRIEPERFDVLEYPPGEEAQVDYGQGAWTDYKNGKLKRPYLFVMTLKFSGKSFRKVVWKTSQQVWARLHEEAFRSFGGCPRYVVLDNLKEGVIKADLYEPELNKVYAAMLAHYGAVAQPCRIRDPDRKGTVERAIQHTQDTALKGRTFETIDQQNAWLAHWEERWAAPRIHGRKKRQVMEMYLEEKPHLLPLPAAGFRMFAEEERRVDDAGLVQVLGNYYAALPADLYTPVKVRIYDDEIVIVAQDGTALRRHRRMAGKGRFIIEAEDRIFNPSRETVRLLERVKKIGAHAAALAEQLFARDGRSSQGTIYGLVGLTRTYAKEDIDRACGRALAMSHPTYRSVKTILERSAKPHGAPRIDLQQRAPEIRPVSDYQTFWELHARSNREETINGNDVK